MSTTLTFTGRKLLDAPLVGPDGAVHYTTSTTRGMIRRKVTTITAASGLVGFIDWREKVFVINGLEWSWSELRSRGGGLFEPTYQWHWGGKSYKLEYHDMHKSLLASSSSGNDADTVRFAPSHRLPFHERVMAMIDFPHQMQDEVERMFLLMAILQTEVHRQDVENARTAAGG